MDIKNPIWRLNNFYKIVDKSGNKITFKQNRVQTLLNDPAKRKRILKARQLGVSTNELLKQLDFVLFNENKNALILAHERDTIEKLFTIVRRAYEFMDPEIRPVLDRGGGSRYSMYFPKNNSRIYCDLESVGTTIHWLHVSEAALNKEPKRIKYTQQAVPLDGIITHETTARGMNHFYEEYMAEDNDFKNYFFPWYMDDQYKIENTNLKEKDYTEDERKTISMAKNLFGIKLTPEQIDYRRFKQRELKELFKQEFAESDISCFLASGDSPFNLEIIKKMYDNAPKPIKEIDGIRIYEEMKPSEMYVLGADPAEGVEGDASAAHIFKVSNREQVASFHSKSQKPSEFADTIIQMAELYSRSYPPILVGVERNNHGHAVLLKLDEIHGYANLYRTRKENKKTELEEVKLGWPTDRVTRPLMIDTLIDGVENGTIILNDKQTLSECLTLINNEGKIEAEEGKHDDLVMAAAIAVQMSIEESKLEIYSNAGGKIKI